jgi:hypothetical protein
MNLIRHSVHSVYQAVKHIARESGKPLPNARRFGVGPLRNPPKRNLGRGGATDRRWYAFHHNSGGR